MKGQQNKQKDNDYRLEEVLLCEIKEKRQMDLKPEYNQGHCFEQPFKDSCRMLTHNTR